MMYKLQKKFIIFCCFLITSTGCIKKNIVIKNDGQSFEQKQIVVTSYDEKINEFVDHLYGKNGVNLNLDQIFMLQDLIKNLYKLSQNDTAQVAAQVVALLEQKNNSDSSPLQQFVTAYIIYYLQQFTQDQINIEERKDLTDLAQQIIAYIDLEQADIFSTLKTKQLFIDILERNEQRAETIPATEQINQLPQLINFWANPDGKTILTKYDPTPGAEIQWVGELIRDMTIMMATMQGASMANAQLGVQGQLLSTQIGKNNQTIQTNMQGLYTQLQENQHEQLQAMMTAFVKAQQDEQEKMAKAPEILNLELDYIYKNISLSKPQQNYIFNQIIYDQLFTLGTMLTPQGPLWKNPFSVGDWEYEPQSNSFWQYQSSPIYNQITDDSKATTNSSLQAENNSIFAEYYTNNESYTIQGSITLYAVSYPFFAGIMFNKSRWISGDFESIRKCRMIGLYATSAQNIGIYFAEQFTMNEEQLKQSPNDSPIQTPLQQILNNKIQPSLSLPSDFITPLPATPVTLNFIIQNSPTKIFFNFTAGNNQSQTIVIDKLDAAIYTYHGIGFICPGAIAEFKLTAPTDFIFSEQAILNYKD